MATKNTKKRKERKASAMTCSEYRDIFLHKMPWDVTRATRAAVIHHGHTCAKCSRFSDKHGPTPAESAELRLSARYRAFLEIVRRDRQDPEYMAIVEGRSPVPGD